MRIDIGPEGKIVGTKRVAADGAVGGLASFAGKDVLIVVPQGHASFRFGPEDYLHEWQKMAQKGAKQALKEVRRLRKEIPSVEELRAIGLKLPDKAVKMAKKELRARGLPTKIPTALQARAIVEKRVASLRREKRVKQAEKWVRARIDMIGAKASVAAA
jgi:hypothetical protein